MLLVPNSVLRFTPPVTPKKQNNGSFVSSLLPHPPRQESTKEQASTGKTQQVWTLHDGQLKPVTITKGASDGKMTEIVAGDVKVGTELVSGQTKQP